jgi:hypothetical protein
MSETFVNEIDSTRSVSSSYCPPLISTSFLLPTTSIDKQTEKCFDKKNLPQAFIIPIGRIILKSIYCSTITSSALKLIRSFDGDVVGDEAILCNVTYEEPSRDKHGRMVEDAFKAYFPNGQAICYAMSGEISFVL